MSKRSRNRDRTGTEAIPEPVSTSRTQRVPPFAAAIVVVLAVLLYANTLGHGWALDDVAVITKNAYTQKGISGIPALLTTFYWQGFWDSNAGLYRPLSMITFALEWELSPDNPRLGHFVNVALYAAIAWLLLSLLVELLPRGGIRISFATTILFIALPVHTEVVANVKSRDELLCFLLFLITARLLLRAHATGSAVPVRIAAATYFLCLMAKEGGLLYLAVFPLMLVWFRDERPLDAMRRLSTLGAVAAGYLAIHWWVIAHSSPRIVYSYQDNALVAATSLPSRVASAVAMLADYARLLLFPVDLSYDYSFNQVPIRGLFDLKVFVSVAFCCALAWVAARGARSRSLVSFAILYAAITLVLTSNVFVLIGATMAERFLFAPSLGFALALAVVLDRLFVSSDGGDSTTPSGGVTAPLLYATAAIVLLWGARTIVRNGDWKDDYTLYTRGVRTAPMSARVRYNAGTAYLNLRAMPERDPAQKASYLRLATAELEQAVRIDPGSRDAQQNLAVTSYQLGDYPKALAAAQRSIELDPKFGAAHALAGSALFRLGRSGESLLALRKAVELGYVADDTWNFIGAASFNLGDFSGAATAFEKALERTPGNPEVLRNLEGAKAAAAARQ
ncbi:MAG: tetratricopeptide repeat protein [Thermoanaerobaculia bacterium]|jgi:tetratricopeptide (TPR) repeat protein